MQEIADELDQYRLDITALQELRWEGSGTIRDYIVSIVVVAFDRDSMGRDSW